MKKIIFLYFLLGSLGGLFAQNSDIETENRAENTSQDKMLPFQLSNFENSSLSWANSGDDVGFIDIFVSVKFPLVPFIFPIENTKIDFTIFPYITFNTRMGFYWTTRPSSPVIGKQFNPGWIITRFYLNGYSLDPENLETYIDLSYNHESNGQAIDSLGDYQIFSSLISSTAYARDYIDRGWDYIELKGQYRKNLSSQISLTALAELQFFLSDGLFQGAISEYESWENDPEGKKRDQVHGIRLGASFLWNFNHPFFTGVQAQLYYITGIGAPFQYHSFHSEVALGVHHIPFFVSFDYGYLNDLTLYYKNSWMVKMGAQFRSW